MCLLLRHVCMINTRDMGASRQQVTPLADHGQASQARMETPGLICKPYEVTSESLWPVERSAVMQGTQAVSG